MDLDAFWRLIDDSLAAASGRADRDAFLRSRLGGLPADDIVAFQGHLDSCCDRVYSWDALGVGMRMFGGWLSDDGFEYFQLWLVGRGRGAFERFLGDPDSLADLEEVRRLVGRREGEWDEDSEWPDWETLNYLAGEVYGAAIGVDDEDEADEAFEAALEEVEGGGVEGLGAMTGVEWDARDEVAAAGRIPRLAVMFPLYQGSPMTWEG